MSHHHHHDHHDHHGHHGDHHHHHQHGRSAIIKNPRSNLVLDACDYEVKLQHHHGGPSQLWQFEEVCPGKYIVVNQGNGKVLDIQGGVKSGHNVITYGKHGGENQQWFINADNTISSVGGGLAIDIYEEHYHPGAHLIAFKHHGGDNQRFHVEYL